MKKKNVCSFVLAAAMGEDLSKVPPHKVVARGMALVPEGRRVFLQMSVQENLEMGAYTKGNAGIPPDLEMVYGQFPRLKERRRQVAGTLSGGEQQMLAMSPPSSPSMTRRIL